MIITFTNMTDDSKSFAVDQNDIILIAMRAFAGGGGNPNVEEDVDLQYVYWIDRDENIIKNYTRGSRRDTWRVPSFSLIEFSLSVRIGNGGTEPGLNIAWPGTWGNDYRFGPSYTYLNVSYMQGTNLAVLNIEQSARIPVSSQGWSLPSDYDLASYITAVRAELMNRQIHGNSTKLSDVFRMGSDEFYLIDSIDSEGRIRVLGENNLLLDPALLEGKNLMWSDRTEEIIQTGKVGYFDSDARYFFLKNTVGSSVPLHAYPSESSLFRVTK